MASPTRAEVITQFQNAAKLLKITKDFAITGPDDWASVEDTYVQSLETDYHPEATSAITSLRAGLNSVLSSGRILLDPVMSLWGQLIGAPETDSQEIINALYDDFIANADTLQSRQFVFAAPAAGGGNAGDGSLFRLTVDEQNLDLEAGWPEAQKAECIADQTQEDGRKHQELFRFTGSTVGRDDVAFSGTSASGLVAEMNTIAARSTGDGRSLLTNGSFDSLEGIVAAPTGIPGWSSNVAIGTANYEFDDTNFYHNKLSPDETIHALRIKSTSITSQHLAGEGIELAEDVPLYLQLAWNRQVYGATGNLTIRLGSHTATVAVAAQAGWQVLSLPINQNMWYRNFTQDDLSVEVDWTSAGGELLVDDVILTPWQPFGGSWYLLIGGQTPFQSGDVFTWTDSVTEAVIQYWLWRAYGRYLPHSAGAPTIADP